MKRRSKFPPIINHLDPPALDESWVQSVYEVWKAREDAFEAFNRTFGNGYVEHHPCVKVLDDKPLKVKRGPSRARGPKRPAGTIVITSNPARTGSGP